MPDEQWSRPNSLRTLPRKHTSPCPLIPYSPPQYVIIPTHIAHTHLTCAPRIPSPKTPHEVTAHRRRVIHEHTKPAPHLVSSFSHSFDHSDHAIRTLQDTCITPEYNGSPRNGISIPTSSLPKAEAYGSPQPTFRVRVRVMGPLNVLVCFAGHSMPIWGGLSSMASLPERLDVFSPACGFAHG